MGARLGAHLRHWEIEQSVELVGAQVQLSIDVVNMQLERSFPYVGGEIIVISEDLLGSFCASVVARV